MRSTDATYQPWPLTVLICRLTGQHELLRETDHDGMRLRCINCGWHSPGWAIEPRQVVDGQRVTT